MKSSTRQTFLGLSVAAVVSILGAVAPAFAEMPKLAYGEPWTLSNKYCSHSSSIYELEPWLDELGEYDVKKTVQLSIEKDKVTLVLNSDFKDGKNIQSCTNTFVGRLEESNGKFTFTQDSSSHTCPYYNLSEIEYLEGTLTFFVSPNGQFLTVDQETTSRTCSFQTQTYKREAAY